MEHLLLTREGWSASRVSRGTLTGSCSAVPPLPHSKSTYLARAEAQKHHGVTPHESSYARVKGGNGWNAPRLIFGPPGTGKTATLLRYAEAELQRGVSVGSLAFVTFTRAATQEVQGRLREKYGLRGEDLPWVRTIHSAAFRLLELCRDDVLSPERYGEFAEQHGYVLTGNVGGLDDAPSAPLRRTDDDQLRFLYEWGLCRGLSPEEALCRYPDGIVHRRAFLSFCRNLEAFKQRHGLIAFSEMLSRALEEEVRPPVDVAFVDEAQDLSPLQVKVVEQWFAPCERIYVAGDDDQAIYEFQGADPGWMLSLADRSTTEVLSKSYRVPRKVHSLAKRLIERNAQRQPKAYEPTDRAGQIDVLSLEDALDRIAVDEETFVLARNRAFLRPVAGGLISRAIPFVVEGGGAYSPLSDVRLLGALRAAKKLTDPETDQVALSELEDFVRFIPCGPLEVPRGVKAEIRRFSEDGGSISMEDIHGLGLGPLIRAVAEGGALDTFQKIPRPVRRYLRAVLDGCDLDDLDPKVTLTSIHGSKGRQRSRVILLTDMSRATHTEYVGGGSRGLEAENRVFYVGMTRAMESLVIVRPCTRRFFEFPRIDEPGS